jgi:hemoglobin
MFYNLNHSESWNTDYFEKRDMDSGFRAQRHARARRTEEQIYKTFRQYQHHTSKKFVWSFLSFLSNILLMLRKLAKSGEVKHMSGQTLFEKYGGFSAISKIVLRFYDVLLDNDDVGPFFDDVDIPKLVDHQTKFIASILGGPSSYTDVQLEKLHSHLTISDAHYTTVETILSDTLREFGFDEADNAEVMKALETKRHLIVG